MREITNRAELERLLGQKFPVLDQGFVALVDAMGDDQAVEEAARVSYGEGTRPLSDTRTLLRYLMRHDHGTPFEMAEVKLLVQCPMDLWRQWIRHRMANVNEYSTRYSEAIDAAAQTSPDAWRRQATDNKQGSSGYLSAKPLEGTATGFLWSGENLSREEQHLQELARRIYERRLQAGVAREQARKDLPLSTYTRAYWKCDVRNLMNFLSLRMDSHAQDEIRQYANVIGEQIFAPLFPLIWEAFNDYDKRRSGLLLSALEVKVIRALTDEQYGYPVAHGLFLEAVSKAAVGWPGLGGGKSREQDECWAKLVQMGLAIEI